MWFPLTSQKTVSWWLMNWHLIKGVFPVCTQSFHDKDVLVPPWQGYSAYWTYDNVLCAHAECPSKHYLGYIWTRSIFFDLCTLYPPQWPCVKPQSFGFLYPRTSDIQHDVILWTSIHSTGADGISCADLEPLSFWIKPNNTNCPTFTCQPNPALQSFASLCL